MDNIKEKNRKKVIYFFVALAIIACLLFAFGVLRYRKNRKSYSSEKEGTIPFEITWQENDYKGIYEGELAKGKPSGEGKFISDDETFSYEGEWKKGLFHGQGTICSSDVFREEGNYSKGSRDGFCRIYQSETSYIDSIYAGDLAYGNQSVFVDGELTESHLIINNCDVSEITENALQLTDEVIDNKRYLHKYVTVEGTVLFVDEDDKTCYLRIDADGLGMVTISYSNSKGKGMEQAFLPNYVIGDQARIYGYYTGFFKDNFGKDKEYKGYNCFSIEPVYGEVLTDKDLKESRWYTDYAVNPYFFYGVGVNDVFTIDRCIRNGSDFYIRAYLTAEENKEDLYMLHIKGDSDDVFYSGRDIQVRGFYSGQYKEKKLIETKDTDEEIIEYLKYPLITVLEH